LESWKIGNWRSKPGRIAKPEGWISKPGRIAKPGVYWKTGKLEIGSLSLKEFLSRGYIGKLENWKLDH
jgi:hypothetical protein